MARISLTPFNCPECKSGNLVQVEIEEQFIREAKRLPAMVTATCSKNHSLVLFVDGNFQVRDIEVASRAAIEEQDAIDKTSDWFDSL